VKPAQIEEQTHPKTFEPVTLLLTALLSVLGAVIGLNLITTLGISPNTSVIGALVAMLVGRLSFAGLSRMRSPHRQNLVQSAISGATFAAANSLLTPIAVPFVLGRPDLVWPMLLGAGIGLVLDSWVLYRVFDSRLLPASNAWPPGVAAAETIKAGDTGGRNAAILGIGGLLGLVGTLLKLPMSAAGVALIGNMWALLMFGVGLAVAQYAPVLFGVPLSGLYIPHGVMIGAGVVALAQAIIILAGRGRQLAERTTTPDARLRRGLVEGLVLFVLGAVVLAVAGGVAAEMSVPALVGWVLLAGVAALVHQLIVGLAAMHSGWFPAFAVTLIFLILGLVLGVPTVPLALLVGYAASTGPAFADMGYDFKAGWLLRRDADPWLPFETAGRQQQYLAQLVGFAVALATVVLVWRSFFEQGLVPPVAKVYVQTIVAGIAEPGVLGNLLLWAIPGALIQFAGGPQRQMGVLLATGLLVASPHACWAVFAGLLVRVAYRRWRGEEAETDAALVGAGLIAGGSVADTAQILRGR
jgi:uncharacterized oligopeptide transporter (OPT) family protein